MSIANFDQNQSGQPRQNEDAKSLSDILGKLPCPQIPTDVELPRSKLPNDAALATYEARILQIQRTLQPLGNQQRGQAMRGRVIRALSYLQSRTLVTTSVPRSIFTKTYQLALFCAPDVDWAAKSGPIIGASDRKIREVLGIEHKAGRALDTIRRHGMIVPFNPRANGHRRYRPACGNAPATGSGFSLLPLCLAIDDLESLVERERSIARERSQLPTEIRSLICAARRLLKPFRGAAWADELADALNALAKRKENATAAETLTAIRDDADSLLADVEGAVGNLSSETSIAQPSGEQLSSLVDTEAPDHNTGNLSSLDSSSGLAEGRRTDRGSTHQTDHRAEAQRKGLEAEAADTFGIERSGFAWHETSRIFPFSSGMFSFEPRPTLDHTHLLGASLQVTQRTTATIIGQLGLEAATIALLVAGQHFADGEITVSTEAYLKGMMKKARKGDLNLGHTIFGRREKTVKPKPSIPN
ncbi:hypothetical protein [Croceicoccus mobilis]|uniref:Uncharacterized protein n=1 Tax=Croceicoccus mobilis TaxID=1703339 RepID=A0A917DZ39_9SPHN|nr:hypothetical protein [Croceicoccus mobilis]GGD82240.1 hypothetical protein GCM10010990_35290 [Croceicoccus mobilis]